MAVRCHVCGAQIALDSPILVSERLTWLDDGPRYDTEFYSHLRCAIRVEPHKVRRGLQTMSRELVGEMAAEVGKLDPALAAIVADRVREPRKASPLDDEATLALLSQLEADPMDRGLLAVLGDHLLERGDERGELISIHLAGEPPPSALLEMLAPRIGTFDTAVWGIGFVRELEIRLDGYSFASRATPLAHPSCRLLSTLRAFQYRPRRPRVELVPSLIPRSLRALEVRGGVAPIDLSSLAHLDTLRLDRCGQINHPTVRSLTIFDVDDETLHACAFGLPGVERLRLETQARTPGPIGATLDATGWLARLQELELVNFRSEPVLEARAREYGFRLLVR